MEKEQTPLPFTANEAWSHMRTVLDREMPEKKKRRRLAFWLLPPALLCLSAIWLLQPGTGKTAHNTATIETKQTAEKDLLTTAPGQFLISNTVKEPAAPVVTTHEQPVLAALDKQAYRRHLPGTVSKGRGRPAGTITGAEESITGEEPIDEAVATTNFYPVAVPLHPVDAAKKLAPVTTRPGTIAPALNAPPPVRSIPANTFLHYGIRTGAVINNIAWARSGQVLFPQRLATLELFVEKPLGKEYAIGLSVNLFSSRKIHYRLEKQETITGPAGLYHRQYHQYTVQALHFTDLQLLLHKQIHANWRLHTGVYLSALKNASVEVSKYDSTARHTGGSTYFETARQKGYTYARKLDGVDMVSPFAKTDIGLMAGIGFRKKQLQAGVTAQWGVKPLYIPVAGAVTGGQRNTRQLKLWLGWQINR